MASGKVELKARYGKQSVPVFRVSRETARHDIMDMMVQIMLEGDTSKSWLSGDNSQILPTETQKNTCYALALKATFDCPEQYAIALARDILERHAHFTTVTVEVQERTWTRVNVDGKPHNHVFTAPRDPVKRTCVVVVQRGKEGTPTVTSGVIDIKLMKTTQSGFDGFIRDKYTNLQAVGSQAAVADRIMCTLMESSWDYGKSPAAGYRATNAAVFDTLVALFAGPADTGVFSKSVQETAYNMCCAVLAKFPEINSVALVTPNIHHYTYQTDGFGIPNPNKVFQSTDCVTSASGRIETRVSRPQARM